MNRKFFAGLAVVALICGSTTLGAQDPDYNLSAGSGSVSNGGSTDINVTLDNDGATAGDLQGWSYGLCHGPEITANSVGDGDTATIKNGSAVDFNERSIFANGYTQGVVICFVGCAVIPAGTAGTVAAVPNYTASGPEAVYPLSFCDNTLGAPAVSNVVVVMGGSITPVQNDGSIEIAPPPPLSFIYAGGNAGSKTFVINTGNGIGGITSDVDFSIRDETVAGAAITQGFSMGNQCDSALVQVNSVGVTGPVAALAAGAGPDFAECTIFANGWTCGVVYSFVGAETISYDATGSPVVTAQYEGLAGALDTVLGNSSTPLAWTNTLGSPAVTNVVVVDGASFGASFEDGSLTYTGVDVTPFRRGDSNDDGIVNIADIVWNLSELFTPGAPVTNCPAADDANGDGGVDIADPIYIAAYQFLGGPPPPAPFPDCGLFPGQVPADCLSYNSCP